MSEPSRRARRGSALPNVRPGSTFSAGEREVTMSGGRGPGLAAALGMVVLAGCATGGSLDLQRLPETPDALVQLRRAGCASGTCPVYGVSIFADRTVVYDGAANVAVVG